MQRGNIRHCWESVFNHKGTSSIFGCECYRNGAAERSTHEYHIVWSNFHSLSKPILGRISIGDAACFAGPTLAVAVASVVEHEDRCVKLLAERCRQLAERRQVGPVAMAVKDYPTRTLPWHKPSL